MDKKKVFEKLTEVIRTKANEIEDLNTFYEEVVKILSENVPYYTWTGFYFMENGELVIGPYIGRPTEHVRIKVGQGVCGRAVAEESTIIVDDVTKEDNYLACSLETKSEIVVPIWANGEIIGEIDIDSDDLAAFDEMDKIFLEGVAEIIGKKVENQS
ncbi:GAF domain-containing protein [Caldanaerobacter sp.]|uniref:GAF domain-containing protein n=1 Tax=Caldanaerobacter sp. TaxID=2930036 RepID=UPI003C733841